MSQGIYKITNIINGNCYIGQSVNIENRWKEHIRTITNKKRHNYNFHIYKSFRKYGTNNFNFEILELVPNKEDLTVKEQYYYDMYQPEYSLMEPKDCVSNLRKVKVHKIDLKTLEILETYDSITEASIKNNISHAHISSTCKGKRAKCAGFYWCYVEKYNKDFIPKKSDVKFKGKKVLQFDLKNNFIKKYDSIHQACSENNFYWNGINKTCNGQYKQSNGYIWRYADEK
jgi:group I intron endonuclease